MISFENVLKLGNPEHGGQGWYSLFSEIWHPWTLRQWLVWLIFWNLATLKMAAMIGLVYILKSGIPEHGSHEKFEKHFET